MLAAIRGVLDAEEGAIETDRSLVDAAKTANDPITEDPAVTVLADEGPTAPSSAASERSTERSDVVGLRARLRR